MSIETLNKRLNYRGGSAQNRLIQDKRKSLSKPLIYSYQSMTAELADGRRFRALMNKNKETMDYYDQILSIPYKDICLNPEVSRHEKTSEGQEETGIKVGDTFTWIENNTHWIIYSQNLNEAAYFNGNARLCEQTIEINGHKYWVYIRGPVETDIPWNQKGGINWNDGNYSLIMFVTKNKETAEYFHRFTKVDITDEFGKTQKWEVASQNPYYGTGMIQVCLNETFNNEIEDAVKNKDSEIEIEKDKPYINGPTKATLYDIVTYTIVNLAGGEWFIKENGSEEKALKITDTSISLDITNKKCSGFQVIYRNYAIDDVTLDVQIVAF